MDNMINMLMVTGNREFLHRIIAFVKEYSQCQCVDLSMYPNVLSFPDLEIHLCKQEVYLHHKPVLMTHYEFRALCYLAQHLERVLTKEQIYEAVYHCEILEDIDNIVYCLIHNLRKKLETDPQHPEYIHTIRGVGYKFEVKRDKK